METAENIHANPLSTITLPNAHLTVAQATEIGHKQSLARTSTHPRIQPTEGSSQHPEPANSRHLRDPRPIRKQKF